MLKLLVGKFVAAGALLIVGLLIFAFWGNAIKTPVETHYHAGFQVYKDNTLQDYSNFEFMHLEPCGEGGHPELTAEEEIEKAHLHDNVGDVVHVHREGVVWGDLFRNIKVELSPDEVYVNGKLLEADFFSYPVNADDSVVVFEGEIDNVENKLAEAVSIEQIREAESLSENCGG